MGNKKNINKSAIDHQARMEAAMEFMKSKDNELASKEISMAYLCFSVGNAYVEDATERLDSHGIQHGKIKTKATNLRQSFDAFDTFIRKMINTESARMDCCRDFDSFRFMCDRFMALEPQGIYDNVSPYSDRNEDVAD